MNPLDIFRHPRMAVKQWIEEPNMVYAIVLVALPTILMLLLQLIFGSFNVNALINNFTMDVVAWFVLGVILYILLYLIKGDWVKGKFLGLLSATSLVRLVTSIMLVVMLLVIALVVPGYYASAPGLKATMAAGDSPFGVWEVDDSLFGLGVMALGMAIVLFLFLFILFILYQVIARAGETYRKQNLLILMIYIVLAAGAMYALYP